MMLFVSVLQGDSLRGSLLQTATLGVTAALLLLLVHAQRRRVGATSVSPETLAWIHDLEIRPTRQEPTRTCLESLDWIQRLRLSRTTLRLSPSPEVAQKPSEMQPHDDVRVLRLHVKALETALDEQIERVRELGECAPRTAQPSQDLDAVLATIRGLRTSTALDPAALRVLDRVEAAVCRLGDLPNGVIRPTLPARRGVDIAPLETPAPVEEHPTVELPAEARPTRDEPVDDVTPVDEPAVETASAPVPRVPDHLVQPVPAPEPAQAATSRRRWARRLAA